MFDWLYPKLDRVPLEINTRRPRGVRTGGVFDEAGNCAHFGELARKMPAGTWRLASIYELKALAKLRLGTVPLVVYLALRQYARGSWGKRDNRRDTRELPSVKGEVIRRVPELARELGMTEDAFRAGMQDLKRAGLIERFGRERWVVIAAEEPGVSVGEVRHRRTVLLKLSTAMLAGLYQSGAGPRATIAYLIERAFTPQPGFRKLLDSHDPAAKPGDMVLTVRGLANMLRITRRACEELRRRMRALGLYLRNRQKLAPVEAIPTLLRTPEEDAQLRQEVTTRETKADIRSAVISAVATLFAEGPSTFHVEGRALVKPGGDWMAAVERTKPPKPAPPPVKRRASPFL